MSELLGLFSGVLLGAAALLLLAPRPAARTAPAGLPAAGHRLRLPQMLRPGSRRRSEHSAEVDPAMLLDLTAALLVSGVGIEAALDRLARCVPGAEPLAKVHRTLTAGAAWEQAWTGVDAESLISFGDHLAFAHATGAPTAELLQVSARQARAERRQEAERRAAQLGVQMVIPLGLCFLPAFVLLGVVPVVLGLLPG